MAKPMEWTYGVAVCRGSMFPFDMLRYDSCWPSRESDSHAIEATTYQRKRAVVVKRVKVRGVDWTLDRWKSYGVEFYPMNDRYEAESFARGKQDELNSDPT